MALGLPPFEQVEPPANGTEVLEAHALTKVYRMGEVDVYALRGVDVSLYAGELVVLLGASGSGKSTLLNIPGGLDTPTGGSVRCQDLTSAGQQALTLYRRQFYNLIPSLTARQNVSLVTDIAESSASAPASACCSARSCSRSRRRSHSRYGRSRS